jgi:AcrR family transcriptional regulator
MARRGEELRTHILGFARASMDVVAARAETSKRSLYAHFESKDKLFLAVVDLAREMYLDRLKTPADYGEDTAEAIVLFCGRFLQLLLREPALRTCRLGIAEAERLPEASTQYYDAIFRTTHERLAAFLTGRGGFEPANSDEVAAQLLARTLHPRLFRALLGVEEPLSDKADETSLGSDVDFAPIRAAVADLVP